MSITEGSVTGAEVLVKTAMQCGVEVCFANPGTTEMHIVGALDTVPGIRPILGLHETVCSGAADGYARMSGKPAMTLLHLGPGLANALANLHNAKRAGVPLLNVRNVVFVQVIGDMASWHRHAETNLKMDIESLAKTVSRWVHTSLEPKHLALDVSNAIAATQSKKCGPKGGKRGRVATLIVPHDLQWAELPTPNPTSLPSEKAATAQTMNLPEVQAFLHDCAKAIVKEGVAGKVALLLGGAALLEEGSALANAGRIAEMVGGTLLCENAPARLDRGPHLPCPKRLPYFPKDALKELQQYSAIVIVDMRRPVAMFGYQDSNKSEMIELDDDFVWEIDLAFNIGPAMKVLLEHVTKLKGESSAASIPRSRILPKLELPVGPLTAQKMCMIISTLQPDGAIVVDESLTSGNGYWEMAERASAFAHLTLTGGAIGLGPPVAVGAAVACPQRQVINVQADGSGLYSPQALWTQAREGLKVITVICANNAYNILKIEMAMQRVKVKPGMGANARRSAMDTLTRLEPAVSWTALATGFGVPAVRVTTCEEMIQEFRKALSRTGGPYLIEAAL